MIPFECNICNKSFIEIDHLYQHVCNETSVPSDFLSQHVLGVHEEIKLLKSPESDNLKKYHENMSTPKSTVPKRSRVLFSSGGRKQKACKSDHISKAIRSLADSENSSVLDIIYFIATKYYYPNNKKLHFIFDQLAKNGENFLSSFG